jgi:hypothetical protein
MPNVVTTTRGKAVNSLRASGVEAGELSPAPHANSPALWVKVPLCAQYMRSLSDSISTVKLAFSPLLFAYFSPLSTGPINTTTKYINN